MKVTDRSPVHSVLFFHLFNQGPLSLLFNAGIMYTIGNYHVKKYGQNHFLRLVSLSCLAGGAIALTSAYSNRDFVASGSFDISGGSGTTSSETHPGLHGNYTHYHYSVSSLCTQHSTETELDLQVLVPVILLSYSLSEIISLIENQWGD